MCSFRRSGSAPGAWARTAARRPREVAAVRKALEIGWRVIDTAEMYGEGGAEEVVGAAMAERDAQPAR